MGESMYFKKKSSSLPASTSASKSVSWRRPFPEQNTHVQPQSNDQADQADKQIYSRRPPSNAMSRLISSLDLPHAMKPFQTKLTVGAPGDKYEQEADQVADQVMSMGDRPQPVQREAAPEEEEVQTKAIAASMTPLVQREMAPEEEEVQTKALVSIQREEIPKEEEIQAKPLGNIQREEMPEEEEPVQTKPSLQRSPDGSLQAGGNLESRLSSSQGGGSPLPDEVRSFMEPRFGADFSQVQVHTGSEAVQMNRDLNAQAFTHKQDVYFGGGKAPAKDALTAHELTHVVQQIGGVQNQQTTQFHEITDKLSNKQVKSRLGEQVIQMQGGNDTKAQTPTYKSPITENLLNSTKQELLAVRGETGSSGKKLIDTYAIVKVVNQDGKVLASELGKYPTVGTQHAEKIALDKVTAGGLIKAGYTVIVMVDQVPCEDKCTPMLLEKLGHDQRISSHVYTVSMRDEKNPAYGIDPKKAVQKSKDSHEKLEITELIEFRKIRLPLYSKQQVNNPSSISAVEEGKTTLTPLNRQISESRFSISKPLENNGAKKLGAIAAIVMPMVLGYFAGEAGKREQQKAQAELTQQWTGISNAFNAAPDQGILIDFEYTRSLPSGHMVDNIATQNQIFEEFQGIGWYQGFTQDEARRKVSSLIPNFIRYYRWIPPIQPPTEKPEDLTPDGIGVRVSNLKKLIDVRQQQLDGLLSDEKRVQPFVLNPHMLDDSRAHESSARISVQDGRLTDALSSIRMGEKLVRNSTEKLGAYRRGDPEPSYEMP